MSVDLIVSLRRSAMPSPAGWQQAIRNASFPVELNLEFDPGTFTGFLPCKFRGEGAGFEYYSRRLTEEERVAAGAPDGADYQVILVTHSDMRELACSLAAASALCRASGGVLYDPQSGQSVPAGHVLAWAVEQLAEAEREIRSRAEPADAADGGRPCS
jgi:hypothetical protein